MDWEIIGRISDILGILSVVVSIGLWVSFGRFKKEIERQKINWIEYRQTTYENLKALQISIYQDNMKNEKTIDPLSQQINEISRMYSKFLKKEDRECVKK